MQTSIVTKDLKGQAKKEIETYTIGDQPMDPARLEILAKVFEVAGKMDVTALRQAIATGDKQTYGGALVDAMNEFCFPASGPAAPAQGVNPATGLLPGHPAVSRSRPATGGAGASNRIPSPNGPGANPRPSPAAQKANSDPYYQLAVNLTKGWPGPDAA